MGRLGCDRQQPDRYGPRVKSLMVRLVKFKLSGEQSCSSMQIAMETSLSKTPFRLKIEMSDFELRPIAATDKQAIALFTAEQVSQHLIVVS